MPFPGGEGRALLLQDCGPPPPTHSLKFSSKRLLGTDSRRSGWAAGSLAGSAESTKMEKPRVRALSHSLASVSVVFVLFRHPCREGGFWVGTALVCSRWATSRGSGTQRIAGVGCGQCARLHRRSGGWSLWRGRGGHCGVKSPSKPAITAAAAKTQEGGLGSGVSSTPYPNTAGPGSPRGTLGLGETSSPCGKMVHR